MKTLKSGVLFKIKGLNIEKNLNILSKQVEIFDIFRHSKNLTSFRVGVTKAKSVKKFLQAHNYEILEERRVGGAIFLRVLSLNVLLPVVFGALLIFLQSPFILQYEILGEENIMEKEVVEYIKTNFPKNKYKLNTKKVEGALYDHFDEISFVSVIVRGQTLVVNIKEKLLPEEIYGEFAPIVSDYDGKITEFELVSGTMAVKIGDYVRAGDVLVYPFYIDGGVRHRVLAKAQITMEIYHTASVQHQNERTEKVRTGRTSERLVVTLFNLPIYCNEAKETFSLYEEEVEIKPLILNNLLPLKLERTTYFELKLVQIKESFAEAEGRLKKEAREKALKKLTKCGIIKNEFVQSSETDGGMLVSYTIVEEIEVG